MGAPDSGVPHRRTGRAQEGDLADSAGADQGDPYDYRALHSAGDHDRTHGLDAAEDPGGRRGSACSLRSHESRGTSQELGELGGTGHELVSRLATRDSRLIDGIPLVRDPDNGWTREQGARAAPAADRGKPPP